MNAIEMPWPEKQVFPNWRQSHHWRTYASPVKHQRLLAAALSNKAKLFVQRDDAGTEILMTVDIYPPDHRRRDRDGMAGACKGILDGISDWLGIDDQHFAPRYVYHEPVKPGKIIARIGA